MTRASDLARSVPGHRSPWIAAAVLGGVVLSLSVLLAGGLAGLVYVVLFLAAGLPGLPVGFALFGRRHAAGWLGGLAIGYAASAVVLWAPVQAHLTHPVAFTAAWALLVLVCFGALSRKPPLVQLPAWTRRDSLALLLVLFLVPVLVWKPFTNIGARDADGNRRYRAYFTADFLWHVALTAELARTQSPPRNPYLAHRPLHYYWAYFVVPAMVSRTGLVPSIQAALAINALLAGVMFVAAIYLFAWVAVPRAGPAAAATLVAVAAASAEGLHATWRLWSAGEPLEGLRQLNIDAITSWFLRGLTIDGLPRSLWYTPQHAAACTLSLIALLLPASVAPRRPAAGMLAGIALGLALIFSPFLGGAFSLIFGAAAVLRAARSPGQRRGILASTAPAALPVMAALGWCLASGTFQGAGGAVAVGLSRMAAAAPLAGPALALGPLLFIALPGLLAWPRSPSLDPAASALAVGFGMYYFVTLTSEPIWIGWRAGQILLVTLPGLAAAWLATAARRHAALAAAVVLLACLAGLPTTVIDTYNAQDVANTATGPGFRWTVVVPPDTHAAMDWIRSSTAPDAVVQMSIGPRGRETWTLIPTFAQRRMAAGQPISLLRMPEYDTRSAEADSMYATADAAVAADVARRLRLDYVFVDEVERQAFGPAAAAKFENPRYFTPVFRSGPAVVYRVN